MRLAEFIRNNRSPIMAEWVTFAQTLGPAAKMSRLQLQDHIEDLLTFIANDIETPQTKGQQISKSHGERDSPSNRPDSAGETHGALRHDDGFDMVQMVSEYRALRGSIIKLWVAAKAVSADQDIIDLTRFNEAIDQALAESVVRFMEKVDYSKDLLLGVLGHDIRNPVGAIKMSARLLPVVGTLNEKQTLLATQMEECSLRITNIVTDLLDLARARMGTRLPVRKAAMDLGALARQVVDEIQLQHPTRSILLKVTGDVVGEWDVTRLGQLFGNLISNAVQYGHKETSVNVLVQGNPSEVTISVQNEGEPIPASQLTTIFHSFTRGRHESGSVAAGSSNLGLGLFITKEIVTSHQGSIDIVSNKTDGTTFMVHLPR